MPNIWGMYAELKATYHATYAELVESNQGYA